MIGGRVVPETPKNQFKLDVWWNNHFLWKGLKSSNWNNHLYMVVWGFQVLHSPFRWNMWATKWNPLSRSSNAAFHPECSTVAHRTWKTTPPMWQKHPGQLSAWGNTSPQTQVWGVASFHFRISLEGRQSCTNWSDSSTCYSSHLCCNTIFTSVFSRFRLLNQWKFRMKFMRLQFMRLIRKIHPTPTWGVSQRCARLEWSKLVCIAFCACVQRSMDTVQHGTSGVGHHRTGIRSLGQKWQSKKIWIDHI